MQSPLLQELSDLDVCNPIDLYAILDKILDQPVEEVTRVCPHLYYLTRRDPHIPVWTVEAEFKGDCHPSQGPGQRLEYVIAKIQLPPNRKYKIYATQSPANRLYTVREAYGSDPLFRALWEDDCEYILRPHCLRCLLDGRADGEPPH